MLRALYKCVVGSYSLLRHSAGQPYRIVVRLACIFSHPSHVVYRGKRHGCMKLGLGIITRLFRIQLVKLSFFCESELMISRQLPTKHSSRIVIPSERRQQSGTCQCRLHLVPPFLVHREYIRSNAVGLCPAYSVLPIIYTS